MKVWRNYTMRLSDLSPKLKCIDMDIRAPNFDGLVVPDNNNETSSNVSSIVGLGQEPQAPFGAQNFYRPMQMKQIYDPTIGPLFGSNMISHHHHQQQPNAQNFASYPPPSYNTNLGYSGESSSTNVIVGGAIGAGPFSPAQLMELQNQTHIYKYIVQNVPIPPHLLAPLTNSLFPVPPPAPHFYSSNPMRWGNPREVQGGRSDDSEPGRCRRTDGKKWRCARDAIPNHKYCERHINRGRNRARRAEQVQRPTTTITTPTLVSTTTTITEPLRILPKTTNVDGVLSVPINEGSAIRANQQPARRIFPSDSFADGSRMGSFIDDWPDLSSDWSQLTAPDFNFMPPLLPSTLPQENNDPVQMGLGVSEGFRDASQRLTNRVPFCQGSLMEGPSNSKSSFSKKGR